MPQATPPVDYTKLDEAALLALLSTYKIGGKTLIRCIGWAVENLTYEDHPEEWCTAMNNFLSNNPVGATERTIIEKIPNLLRAGSKFFDNSDPDLQVTSLQYKNAAEAFSALCSLRGIIIVPPTARR